MEPVRYTKLSLLVNGTFTVESVGEYVFKRWNPAESKMETSMDWQEGFTKKYQVTTDKGVTDFSAGQLGNLLEAVSHSGKSDLIGKTFKVKSNGKMGMDIRYFFNPVKKSSEPEQVPLEELPEGY